MKKAIVGVIILAIVAVWFFRERTYFTTERSFSTEPKNEVRIHHSAWGGETILMKYPASSVQQAKNAETRNIGAAIAPADPIQQVTQGRDDPGSRLIGDPAPVQYQNERVEREENGAQVIATPQSATATQEFQVGGETQRVEVTWQGESVASVKLNGESVEEAVLGTFLGIPIGFTAAPGGS